MFCLLCSKEERYHKVGCNWFVRRWEESQSVDLKLALDIFHESDYLGNSCNTAKVSQSIVDMFKRRCKRHMGVQSRIKRAFQFMFMRLLSSVMIECSFPTRWNGATTTAQRGQAPVDWFCSIFWTEIGWHVYVCTLSCQIYCACILRVVVIDKVLFVPNFQHNRP